MPNRLATHSSETGAPAASASQRSHLARDEDKWRAGVDTGGMGGLSGRMAVMAAIVRAGG